ncbi:MAG: GntR family transcriptional regulator [Casimicrobiaceae bacterium]
MNVSVKRFAAAKPNPPSAAGKSLAESAYQTMRRRILDNVWLPGFRTLEQQLAVELGMSRTPVREAMLRLQNEGLVEVIPRHGMSVLPVSADDMRDIYEMLTALEAAAAALAVHRGPSAADLKPLENASREMTRALDDNDLEAWASADESFHQHLVMLSGNRLLIEAVQNCWDRAHRARMVTLRMRPKPSRSTREHMDVVDKIRAGDARGAFDTHRAHRERGSRELLAILEQYQLRNL